MKEPQEQAENSPADRIRPWQYKKGQSGNPGGRPKGTVSLKEYARKYLQEMSEDEKQTFMEGLNKDTIWKMSEGNPKQDTQSDIVVTMPTPIIPLDNVLGDNSNKEDNKTETED